ncbi:MAG: acetolactate synthase large subunit [Deltaproteobacteria bacterium]|nr:acetolactate synthase large subunit [Deltaproteobacteria bacterium]MBW2446467.1 acetolactate synthase large subunit [Deltaproteobacteria bacterium]
MNGAESLVRTAVAAGVDVCFANPGTTEMPLVAALDSVPGMRGILGLFEGVCTGAADGYGRMTGKPALTLLHLGPGFANGIANLHNARRAPSPVVNVIGDHASWHLAADAPLTSDIESLAKPVSCWLRSSGEAARVGQDTAEAIAAAQSTPGGVATLIVPADAQWSDGGQVGRVVAGDASQPAPLPSGDTVDAVAGALRGAQRPAILLRGSGLLEPGLGFAARIAAACGARLLCDTFPARAERGAGRAAVERIGYFPEQGAETLKGLDLLVLAGSRDPVTFFGYPDIPSRLAPEDCRSLTLAEPTEDVAGALEALADALGAPAFGTVAAKSDLARPTGALDPGSMGAAIAALQPENAIIMDEGATSGLPHYVMSTGAPPHTYLALTGGAIGQGFPCATGAAVACPDRKVIALQADGSGMYTLQALWTQAREGLDVTTIVCSNRSYRILQIELARAGVAEPGRNARGMTDLSTPPLDWVSLSKGLGVPAVRAEDADTLVRELERALAEPGPSLIEAVL